jgi:hypothetical protein
MRSVTTSQPRRRQARVCALAAVVLLASYSAIAQTDDAPIEPGPPPVEALITSGEDAAAPDERLTADQVATDADPVATNQKLLATNLAEFGRKSVQVAEAYIDLADAQRRA